VEGHIDLHGGERGVFGGEGGEEEPNHSWGRNEWSAGSVQLGQVVVEHKHKGGQLAIVAKCRMTRVLIEVLVLI